MSKPDLKRQAINLRKRGLSYLEINRKIGVSKSTLSYWLKDIKLSPEQRQRLYTKEIRYLSFGAQSQRERRKREIEQIITKGMGEVKMPLDQQAFRLFGAALYWSEGRKSNIFEVTNSDPHLILFMVEWFEKVFQVSRKNFKARLSIYSQQNDKHIKKFWSELTGIPFANFNKSFVKPANKGYKKNNLYYGTIKITVPSGSNLRHQVFGWVQSVLTSVSPKVLLVQERWQKLAEVKRPANL